MKKFRIALILAVIVTLLVPVSAQAAGVFYCSTLIPTGGDGSYSSPWACSTQAQLDYIIYDVICEVYNGGHLYQIRETDYVYLRIEWVNVNGQLSCQITYREVVPGYPPDTGPEMSLPMMLGIGVLAGGGMLGAGMALRRKRMESLN